MISIGNQTAWAATPTEPFEYALANGFDAFEWFPDKKPGAGWDDSDLDESQRRTIRESALGRGMRLSVHARWQANPLQAESLPILLKDLDLAGDLGAALLNIHLCHEQGIAAFVEAITPLFHRTAEARLQLSIENTPNHTPEDFNELFAFLAKLDSVPTRHVGMCLDLGHANLCAATRNNYLGFLDRLTFQVPIIHLHLHENWGDADSHLPLFTGPAARDDCGIRAFLKRMQSRRFAGSIILEQWPQPPSLLNNARNRLLALLKDAAPEPGQSAEAAEPAAPSLRNFALSPAESSPPLPSDGRGTGGEGNESPDGPAISRSHHHAGDAKAEPGSAVAPHDFAEALVAADKRSRSWREKLDSVRELLSRETAPLTVEQLVDVAIYLKFLGTGQVACVEDGRHFRPGHHASIALEIQQRLAGMTEPQMISLVRRILPWLPSSAEAFRRAEPLTRIRDIAHRNDIPSDLKRDIKNSLQNKLHRCAGPEDLTTSAEFLKRITAPGANFPPAFVEQFRIFHDELKEFFNASSLDQRLQALLTNDKPPLGTSALPGNAGRVEGNVGNAAQAELRDLIRSFFEQKPKTGLAEQLATLETLTKLRGRLLEIREKNPGAQTQDYLLVDIALEDFAFVLLSNIINLVQSTKPKSTATVSSQASVARAEQKTLSQLELHDNPLSWRPLLEALLLAIANIHLSHIAPEESGALQAELRAWCQDFDPSSREKVLRLKATIERSRRLAEDFSDGILRLFPQRVEKLGRALGVPQHALRVFSEAELRGHLVFQFSKLISVLLRQIREQLDLPAWEVLVPGQTVGLLKVVESLDELRDGFSDSVIALLKHAEGDEEIPNGVAGIVLAHEIPHLSHLGVRARQAGVIFAVTQEAETVEKLSSFDGQTLALSATPEKVEWKRSVSSAPDKQDLAAVSSRAPGRRALVQIPPVRLTSKLSWIPIEQATSEIAGGKADGVRRLIELSKQGETGFVTPPALAVPFGVMEAALESAPELKTKYAELTSRVDAIPLNEVEHVAQSLRDVIRHLNVSEEIVSTVAGRFGSDARLMVRSSANCEDLEEFAGAGLYESLANVAPNDLPSAVLKVWSSLWTRRATLSRRQAGIPHQKAYMAVLIQKMLAPDCSFILHTVNPITQDASEIYAELAVGLGETLASASVRGTPYRLVCDKESGSVTTLAFANFSQALYCAPSGVERRIVDYSQISLSVDLEARHALGRRLAHVGGVVERSFHKPQDIEGALVGSEIYLVQSRAQQAAHN